jgi:hypothetical protein
LFSADRLDDPICQERKVRHQPESPFSQVDATFSIFDPLNAGSEREAGVACFADSVFEDSHLLHTYESLM